MTSSCSDQITPAISTQGIDDSSSLSTYCWCKSTQGIDDSSSLVPPVVWCDFITTAFKVLDCPLVWTVYWFCVFYVDLVDISIKQTPVDTQAGDNSIDSGAVLQLEAMRIQGSPPAICASSPNASPQTTDCSLDDNTCVPAASQVVENAGAMTNRHDSINSKWPPP